MFAHGEFSVSKIVTITKKGDVIPPCGRCLELISQLNNPDFIEIAITEKEIFIRIFAITFTGIFETKFLFFTD